MFLLLVVVVLMFLFSFSSLHCGVVLKFLIKHEMMAFILATDFDFTAYMSKMAFFGKLFSRQWRFWNMISMIFVVLYDLLHYCNLPL